MSAKTSARQRAREAKARADADRIAHDNEVERLATAFYEQSDAVERFQDELTIAVSQRDNVVIDLLGLGESAERVALLTGLEVKEIRRIKRERSGTVRRSGADQSVTRDPAGE